MRAHFIVGPRGSRAAKGLLSDDRAGRLVVDIEVARSESQAGWRLPYRLPVAREDGSGEGIGAGAVAEVENLVEIGIVVDVDGYDGAKQFLAHRSGGRVTGDDHGGPDEPTRRIVAGATDDFLDLRSEPASGFFDRGAELIEAGLGDYYAHEVPKVGDVADADLLDGGRQAVAQTRPERPGDVGARGGGALLALVFEGAADHAREQRIGIRAGVGDDEVLAARLADDGGGYWR